MSEISEILLLVFFSRSFLVSVSCFIQGIVGFCFGGQVILPRFKNYNLYLLWYVATAFSDLLLRLLKLAPWRVSSMLYGLVPSYFFNFASEYPHKIKVRFFILQIFTIYLLKAYCVPDTWNTLINKIERKKRTNALPLWNLSCS